MAQRESGAGESLSPATEPASGGFTPSYRWYALSVLTAVYTVNYVDRQILSILLQPIKMDLGLSDTQLGFLSGIAFAIFYATLGIPIAFLADRTSRRNIITASLALFSGMTALCAFVGNFWHLALLRIGVGIGEAGSSPPSHSMIADMFPPAERGAALGIFSLGVNIGILIGFLVGGWMAEWFGWRVAFFTVGLPGLLLAVLVRTTLKEPQRGFADGLVDKAQAPAVLEVARFLWTQRSFRHIALGTALCAFVGYAGVVWLPPFLARSFHLSPGIIGTSLALIIGFSGGLGTYLGGYLGDRLGKRDVRWNLWVPAIIWIGVSPFSFAVYMSSSPVWALALFVIPAFAGAAYLAPCLSMVQSLVTLRMRAVASAILLFILNIIGLGLGPQTVGLLSDYYQPSMGEESLRYALLTVSVVGFWGAAHFILGARTLKADIARATAHGIL